MRRRAVLGLAEAAILKGEGPAASARRAEAAVIAWMRHQTTAYDSLRIARVKGERREVRRQLAEVSRAVLDLHRRDAPHLAATCPLCAAVGDPAT